MQTFAPYPDAARCAEVLDLSRLGKQIIECQQIVKAICDPDYGWQNHPAINMWRGHLGTLLVYQCHMATEWRVRRGKPHAAHGNTLAWLTAEAPTPPLYDDRMAGLWPHWWGDDAVHASHRSNLLRKDPDHYGAFGWTEPPTLDYVWPTKEEASV